MEAQKGTDSLPEDTLILIMSKLPVKSLLRFNLFRLLDSSPPGDGDLVILWNPATKDLRYLPEPAMSLRRKDSNIMSFEFDYRNKDYKLVIFELNNYKDCKGTMFRFQVFSKSCNSWRVETEVNDILGYEIVKRHMLLVNSSVIVNEILYLVGYESSKDGYTILSFNLHDKKFDGKISMPPSKNRFFLTNSWNDDSLCLLQRDDDHDYHFWVNADHRSHSWTEIFKVKNESVTGSISDYRLHFTGVWKNEFIFAKQYRVLPYSGEQISVDLNHRENKIKTTGPQLLLF
ncbi:F-box associated domain [Trema orientale]|uniref:F-box associated domain n=1 Tax=Trema orientale TaxID=63057 RepID=A0A2P5BJF3_TREOI|nr:F-box associated domain [Trema orientale]